MLKSFRGIHIFAASALLATTLVPLAARAADMPMAPPLDAYDDERVTFGTGWYLRGDIAATNDVKLTIGNTNLPSGNGAFNSFGAGLGFGYKYNEWVRSDVTVDWRSPRSFMGNTSSGIACQTSAAPIFGFINGTQTVVGSYPVYGSCSDMARARIQTTHALLNGYIDLPTFVGITPYVGAGVGLSVVYQKFTRNWFLNNGMAYAPSWTDPYTTVSYSNYWDVSRSATSYQFAWALMAGVSYALNQHAAVDVGYRYVDSGKVTNYASFGGTQKSSVRSQELRIGLRYTPD